MAYKILIVDDSPVLRIMLGEMLKSLGHTVVAEADSAAAGLKAFREKKPDVVTLDVSLPDGNGLQVLEQLRRIDPAARVLMVTGNDQKAIEDKAMALKALGVLHKPFDEGELQQMLEKAAARGR
ncbi:MAG: response regulator [Elusimicrobia bacterium]|nr:response regulator [Elusimicrobiota bacterium]